MQRFIKIQRWPLVLSLLLLALFGLYLWLLSPDVIGLMYDDGMYYLAAKALSQGDGYRLLNVVGTPSLYKYPPLFSLLLSGLIKVTSWVQNATPWIKLVNILLSIGSLGSLYILLTRQKRVFPPLAIGIVALLGTHWTFIESSIELMTEPLFLLLSFVLLIKSSELESQSKPSFKTLLPLIILSVLCFYTRTMGALLILSLGLYIALRHHWKSAFRYLLPTGLLCLPWLIWSRTKVDYTQRIGDFLIRSFQETYFQSFLMDIKYEYNPFTLYTKGVETLIGDFSTYLFPILSPYRHSHSLPLQTLIFSLSILFLIMIGYYAYSQLKSQKYTLTGIYTTLYLLLLPFWSFFDFYNRFLLLVLPFLMVAVCQNIANSPLSKKFNKILVTLFILTGCLTNSIGLIPYLHKPYQNTLYTNTPIDTWKDYQAVFAYMQKKTSASSIWACDNINEEYIYTVNGNRAFFDYFFILPKVKLEALQQKVGVKNALSYYIQETAYTLKEILKRNHVNYFIVHQGIRTQDRRIIPKKLPTTQVMFSSYPNEFKPVMQSPSGYITVYQFLPSQS